MDLPEESTIEGKFVSGGSIPFCIKSSLFALTDIFLSRARKKCSYWFIKVHEHELPRRVRLENMFEYK